jgi:hypothetical protein
LLHFAACGQSFESPASSYIGTSSGFQVATRIALLYQSRRELVLFRPTKEFLAFTVDFPLSRLEGVLADILGKGTMQVKIGEKPFNIIFRLPDPGNPQTVGQQIYCGSVYSV